MLGFSRAGRIYDVDEASPPGLSRSRRFSGLCGSVVSLRRRAGLGFVFPTVCHFGGAGLAGLTTCDDARRLIVRFRCEAGLSSWLCSGLPSGELFENSRGNVCTASDTDRFARTLSY